MPFRIRVLALAIAAFVTHPCQAVAQTTRQLGLSIGYLELPIGGSPA
jgi:hypothetical protein